MNQIADMFTVCIGSCAFFISLLALIISIWQGIETRKNYHLSLLPHLTIDGYFIPNNDFVGLRIVNRGVGPAKIVNIKLSFNSSTIFDIDHQIDLFTFIDNHNKNSGADPICYKFIGKGELIMAGESFDFVWFQGSDLNNRLMVDHFKKIFSNVEIEFKYDSIYNDHLSNSHMINIRNN